jgi:hypothetical protein
MFGPFFLCKTPLLLQVTMLEAFIIIIMVEYWYQCNDNIMMDEG